MALKNLVPIPRREVMRAERYGNEEIMLRNERKMMKTRRDGRTYHHHACQDVHKSSLHDTQSYEGALSSVILLLELYIMSGGGKR